MPFRTGDDLFVCVIDPTTDLYTSVAVGKVTATVGPSVTCGGVVFNSHDRVYSTLAAAQSVAAELNARRERHSFG
jgi:hypothetical protein